MFWTREILKSAAKSEMKLSFWKSAGLLAISAIISSVASGMISNVITVTFYGAAYGELTDPEKIIYAIEHFTNPQQVIYMLGRLSAVYITMFLVSFGISIFLSNPLMVGESTFFIRAPYGERDISNLFHVFRSKETYWPVVKTMFFRGLYLTLWGLLPFFPIMISFILAATTERLEMIFLSFLSLPLMIPLVVKSYEFRMVPYIVSETPDVSPQQALRISKEMTNGEKFDIWVLDISFIGWALLWYLAVVILVFIPILGWIMVIPTGFIGLFALMVYMRNTDAQLYFALRHKYFSQKNQQQ